MNAKLLLDLPDAFADDRLADVEFVRGGAESTVARARDNVAKVAQVQLLPPRRCAHKRPSAVKDFRRIATRYDKLAPNTPRLSRSPPSWHSGIDRVLRFAASKITMRGEANNTHGSGFGLRFANVIAAAVIEGHAAAPVQQLLVNDEPARGRLVHILPTMRSSRPKPFLPISPSVSCDRLYRRSPTSLFRCFVRSKAS